MNELKPEDVMKSCDRAQPSDERSALREYRRRIYEAVNYRGTDDHDDVTTILLEYKKALLREKDAEIERLRAEIGRLGEQCHVLTIEYPKTIRAEAITEFLERAYAKARDLGDIKPYATLEDLEEISKKLQEDLS